jgi:F-type H+-transporting ATPase subunit a
MLFLIIMYAFEVFVAFIQAYVFTILTAVYIQSSVHASEH